MKRIGDLCALRMSCNTTLSFQLCIPAACPIPELHQDDLSLCSKLGLRCGGTR